MRQMWMLLMFGLVLGCTSSYSGQRPDTYYAESVEKVGEASLFSGDASVLSDDAISRILQHRYEAPPLSRIAVLPFGWSQWSGWSEQLAIVTDRINEQVLGKLESSGKVYDATLLPSILVPEKRTVPYLREAAARFQADLLLVFRSSCESFEKYRLFGADEAKAYCSVEAVLLDTRSGLVPFVGTSLQNFTTRQQDGDVNFREAVLRSQLEALGSALAEISTSVVSFLESGSSGV